MLVTGNSGSTNCSKESHGPNQQYRLIRIQQAIDIDTTCSQLIRDLFGRHSLGQRGVHNVVDFPGGIDLTPTFQSMNVTLDRCHSEVGPLPFDGSVASRGKEMELVPNVLGTQVLIKRSIA
eukprot:m.197310 g.197310  ORF g.197310 m.197310 type:complete len:121 (+) comp15276_c0_seq1:3426-3788(+)